MKRLLIKGGKLLYGQELRETDSDILIEGDRIVQILQNISCDDVQVIAAEDKLIIPGLVNAHLHSDENLFKGMFDNMPLELWILYTAPAACYGPFSEELIYLRTMIGAVEMVKKGVTSIQDDVSFYPAEPQCIDAVMKAYEDIGLRANVAINACDREWKYKIPYVNDITPNSILNRLPKSSDKDKLINIQRYMVKRWHNPGGLLNVTISLSAPQRCSDDFYIKGVKLAKEYNIPVSTHVCETKVQAVTGPIFYGKSIVKYMKDLNVLSDRMSIVHSVWMTDDDIRIMAESGVSVIHNPVSNLKLGSGIMPYNKLKTSGINIALGTDGMSSNDSQSIFEQMKTMAFIQKIADSDYSKWPGASEILQCATYRGAKSVRREKYTGCIKEGMKADLVILDMKTPAFTPLNDVKNHLVYCENGSSVEHVIIDGKVVMDNKKLMTVREKSVLSRLKQHMEMFIKRYGQASSFADKLAPYVSEIYTMCADKEVGINRWAGK